MSHLPSPGTGYFVAPPQGPGPGVLLIHSAWGLTPEMKIKADELADAGFTVLAPDLNDGMVAEDDDHATELLLEADIDVTASLVQSSLRLLRAASADPDAPAGVVGYSSGASWALWLSERLASQCRAVVGFYGTQSLRFDEAEAAYLLHFASEDAAVSDDEVAMLGLNLQLARCDFRLEHHPGVAHGFAEPHHPGFDPQREVVAWRQSLEFLAAELRPG